jgi:hypothetical protein
MVAAESLVSVVLRRLLRQRRPQPLAVKEASVVHHRQDLRLEVVSVDRLRQHLQLDHLQPVVAAETVATAQPVSAASAAMAVHLWSTAPQAAPQGAAQAATAEPTVLPAAPVAPQLPLVAELRYREPPAREINAQRPCQHCWQGLCV